MSAKESAAPAGAALPALPPDALIIVPVRNTVLFPGLVLPITLGRPKSIAAAQQAVRDQRQVGILLQRVSDVEDPAAIDMHRMGALANIVRYITAPDGTHHLVCQGEQRFQIVEYLSGWPFMVARVLRIPEAETRAPEIEARFVNLKAQAVEAIQLLPQVPADLLAAIQSIEAPAALADLAAAYMDIKPEEKQEISKRSTSPRAWTRSRGCSRTESKSCACPRRSAGKPRRRSTSASAKYCCANRWRRSSASLAKARRARPPKWPSSTRLSAMPACRRKSRRRRARNCGGCSACPKRPANTAWCARISTGSSNCRGNCRRRSQSISRTRGASSTTTTTISTRSSGGSSSFSPCASFPHRARRRSSAS